ncbi:polysaccharide deacetylase family protein [Prochlorococcus sp. MIT 1341]|uniref:polysaccharide deacetylase family protein n=1 Tax=Prochlorococcus sp. MIT 1341 TaxID=3096221 RepID=UPI002A756DA3|nr:polysaccharide deacetylase family protein [Prochlorococcus sp. MIT 1341]
MNIKQKRFITKVYKLRNINRNDDQPFRTLMYHSIKKLEKKTVTSQWELDLNLFIDHMNYLKEREDIKIKKISALESLDISKGIAITFDDGLRDIYENAAPILLEMKIPFTIFVITNFIKSKKSNYIDEVMLRELASSSLVTIGSHSMNHVRLTEISTDSVKKEINSSKKYLEDILSKEITSFSYPYGKYNSFIQSNVKKAGYKIAFSSDFNKNSNREDKYCLSRTEIWNNDSLNQFIDKINGNWDWLKYRNI